MNTDTNIQQLKQTAVDVFSVIARSIDGRTTCNTELDLIDMLKLIEHVIVNRLNKPQITNNDVVLVPHDHYEERHNDACNNYVSLYNSIRLDVIDTIRETFKHPNTGRTGPIVQRVVSVGIDSVFNVIKQYHPTESTVVVSVMVADITSNINKLGVVDIDDATAAVNYITNMIRARSINRRPPTKAQRLQLIESIARKFQDDMELIETTTY